MRTYVGTSTAKIGYLTCFNMMRWRELVNLLIFVVMGFANAARMMICGLDGYV